MILLLGELTLHLLKLHRVLVDGFSFLINLLLQRTGDLHHVLVVAVDLISGTVRVLLQVLQAEGPLVKTDVERGDIATKANAQSVK